MITAYVWIFSHFDRHTRTVPHLVIESHTGHGLSRIVELGRRCAAFPVQPKRCCGATASLHNISLVEKGEKEKEKKKG